jgi:hypothetical protein
MPADPDAIPESNRAAGRIAILTASLLAVAGLIDALTAVINKTQSLTCLFGISLPWCAPHTGSYTIADFEGVWINKNPMGDIGRIDIDQRLDKATVHIWGKCIPTDCDWGTAETPAANASTGIIQVQWNPGFKVTSTALTIRDGKQLQVDAKTHFTDKSGRPDYETVNYLERK